MIEEHETYDIYYDKEGDFLEITFGLPPKKEYAEEIEPGVFILKNEETGKIRGIGILSFKKRTHVLKKIMQKINLNFPLEINIASLEKS